MKNSTYVIRNFETGQFYGEGAWVASKQQAQEFDTLDSAAALAQKERLKTVEVMMLANEPDKPIMGGFRVDSLESSQGEMYRQIRILMAEDNEGDILLLQRAFDRAGIKAPLQAVRNGQEAIQYLSGKHGFEDRKRFPLPNLMLLDLKMPLVDGFEVLKWLRAQPGLRRLPVIVFSSSALEEDVNLAHDLGANAFAQKPNGFQGLFETVKAIEEFWLKRNCFPKAA